MRHKLTHAQGTTTESPATSATPSPNKSSQARKSTRSSIRTLRCELSSPPSLPPSRLESPKSNRQNVTRRLRGTAQRPAVLDQMGVSLEPFSSTRSYVQHLPDTQWGHGGCGSALNGARDVVSVVALTKEPCPLVVSIGEQRWTFQAGTTSSVSYFEVQFDSTITGPVGISLDENTTEGPAIVNECCHGQVSPQAPQYSQVSSGGSNTGFSSSSTVSLFGLNDDLSLDTRIHGKTRSSPSGK